MPSLQMLVKQHQAKAAQRASESINWDRRKTKWLAVLQQLIDELRAAFIAAGVASEQIATTRHLLTEETLGSYEAPGLEVTIGRSVVKFIPIASVIIGGYGRVDVTGPLGDAKLIADTEPPLDEVADESPSYERDWIWLVYPDRSRRGGFRLDEQGLVKVLELVLGDA
jgi:hypothetical protein